MAARSSSGAGRDLIIDSLPFYQKALQSVDLSKQSSSLEEVAPELQGEKPFFDDANLLTIPTPAELHRLPSFPSSFPFVKRIPGTNFVVDGFRSAGPWSVSYFLSHFHSDHYTGLTNLWQKGLVFCSEITAHLLQESLQVPESLVVSLPMGKPVTIDGSEVTLAEANHCPGAVQFLFRIPGDGGQWYRYVHCGDMRYSPAMKSDSSLCDFVGADAVFLDTTYCNPKFVFPPQQASVNYVADTVHRLMEADLQGISVEEAEDSDATEVGEESDGGIEEENEVGSERDGEGEGGEGQGMSMLEIEEEDASVYSGSGRRMEEGVGGGCKQADGRSTLFLISTYVIGKEKILTAVARRCNCSIYVTEKKLAILRRLDIEEIEVFTTDPAVTNVHVVKWSFLGETWPYFRPNFVNMEKAMQERGYRKVVGFVPTGWTYELKKKTFSVRKKGPFEIHLVPYSEHSNYEELREYVGFLRPKEIIPTVGLDGGGMGSKAVATMRKHFRNLVDETASKRKFLKGFRRRPPDDNLISSTDLEASNSVVAPKAVFGRAARKRRRETDEGFVEEVIEPSVLMPEYEPYLKKSEDINQSAVLAAAGNSQASPHRVSRAEDDEMQLDDRASGLELNEAYLEEGSELKLSTSVMDGVHMQKDERQFKSPKRQEAERTHRTQELTPSRRAVNGQITGSQSGKTPSSQRSVAAKSKNNKRPEGRTQGSKKKVSTAKRGKKGSTSSLPFKKVSASQSPSSASALLSRNQRAMQSSILNFFKKPGEDVNPAQIRDALTGKLAVTSNEKHGSQSDGEPVVVSADKVLNSDSIEEKVRRNKWADEYEQLASILDGDLSVEQAHGLLEMASGNVGIALDLFYMGHHVGDTSAALDTLGESTQVNPSQSELLPGGEQTAAFNENPCSPSSPEFVTQVFAQDEVFEYETSQGPFSRTKWPDEYEQLVSILDGNLSTIDANVLLENAGGDVAIALDLFYSKESAAQVRCPPNTDTEAPLNRGKEPESGPMCQVSTAPDNKVQFSSGEGKNEPSEALSTKQFLVGASAALLLPLKRNLDGTRLKNAPEKNPSSVAVPVAKYSPLEHACWEIGEPAPYLHLARAFDLIEQESGRLRTADMLCNMFRSLLALSPEAVLPAVYLTTNRIVPDFESGELSIGGSLVTTAITEAVGVPRAKLREMYNSMGDLGDVAQACRQTQSSLRLPPRLGICYVFSTLKQISKEAGNGSGARKKDLVLSLLRACREREMKYIVRTLIQNMRIGAMMKTVLSALAQAVVLHHSFSAGEAADKALVKLKPKFQEASAVVMEAYNFLPNLDIIVPTMIKDGVGELSANFTISPGTPIKPMLAKITNGIPELLKRFQGQPFTCEYKYDGQRAQIHMLLDGTVRIFSRDSGDATGRFPDVINIVRDAASEDLKSFIIDAEVVAVDRENDNKLMAFQHLSTRERGGRDGNAVSLQSIKVSDRKKQLVIQDLSVLNFGGSSDSKPIRLLRNHEVRCSLVKIPFQERRQRMHHWFPNTRPGYFGYANEITIEAEEDPESTSQKVLGYLEEAFAASCEGLMAKALLNDSSYMASKRSDSWLKIKRDYVEGLQDSLDLVPIGAWHGNGRKAGWYSPFLLACYDPDSEEYQSVCRVMSGFTDVFYKEITQFYTGDHVLPRKPPYYRTGEEPDVWLTPEIVWEIRGADFTVSPVHQAAVGLIHPSRGISMRFPRFIRSRPDKKPDIASTPSDVAHLFHGQTRKLDVPGSKVKVVSRSDSQE